MENKLIKKIVIQSELELITGLHIGASSDNVEIGGVDNPVVRKTIDNIPYIPGSSLKGKIRCLLEQIHGADKIGGNDVINDLFGFADKDRGKPSKIIIRDAYLNEKTIEILSNSEYTDLPFTEVKNENRIDRVLGTASDPRRMERVPAGSIFNIEIIINVWNTNEDGEESVALLEKGIHALENDYLGGSGSRGYGQVKFGLIKKEIIDFKDYLKEE